MTKKMLMAVACLGAAIGSAQTMNTVKMNLPVAAKVGKVNLPAGKYSIHEMSNSVIEITSEDHKGASTLVAVMPIVAPDEKTVEHTNVVLREEKDGLQVDKIWLEGQEMGFELTTAAE